MNYRPESVSREVSNFLQFYKAVGNLCATMRTATLWNSLDETDPVVFAAEAAMLLAPLSVDTFPTVWVDNGKVYVEVAVSENTSAAILRHLQK